MNRADYTPAQLDAWADGSVDIAAWDSSFTEHYTLVAAEGDAIVGFGYIAPDGYPDRLYVHCEHQRRGIASALCDRLEAAVNASVIVTHASVTAKPFFEQRGYVTVREQQVMRKGILLTNFVMEKNKER